MDPPSRTGEPWGSHQGGCWDAISIRSLFQDAELLPLLQPQVPIVLGLVVVQGHHQLIWEDKRRGRVAVVNWGGVHSRPLPWLDLTLQGGAWRSRGLVGHQRILHLRAIADQPLRGDKEPREPSPSWDLAIPWPSLEVFGHWDGGRGVWRRLATGRGKGGSACPLLTWRLLSGSMG